MLQISQHTEPSILAKATDLKYMLYKSEGYKSNYIQPQHIENEIILQTFDDQQ